MAQDWGYDEINFNVGVQVQEFVLEILVLHL